MGRPIGSKNKHVPNPISIHENYIEVFTASGRSFAVDIEDYFGVVHPYRWHASEKESGSKRYYVQAHDRVNNEPRIKKRVWLHRLILAAPKGVTVDHINGDPLDNRRCNLRLCSTQQNSWNQKARDGTSSLKGVHYDRRRKKWKTEIKMGGKRHHIGRFDSEIEAAQAYEQMSRKLYGEFAFKININPIKISRG